MPSIKKRGSSYRIMVSLGYDMAGKQIRKTTTYTPPDNVTPGKAEKLATEFAYEYEKKCRGMINLNENIRFKELYDWYYEQIAPHVLKEHTMHSHSLALELYVLPNIGHMKIKDITTSKIDELFAYLHKYGSKHEKYIIRSANLITIDALRPFYKTAKVSKQALEEINNGREISGTVAERIAAALDMPLDGMFKCIKTETPLSPATISIVRGATSAIFTAAVKKEIIHKNPVKHATSPKKERQHREFMNAKQCVEILSFVDEIPTPQVARAIKILLYTGMRVGELTALHWSEIDFENATIDVRYNLYRVHGEFKLSSPKTKSSARVIAVPQNVLDLLNEQKEWQIQRKKEVGDRWKDVNAVFTGITGDYMNKNMINTLFKQVLKEHNFPDFHLHDLRHANASLLINSGVPVKVISEHLGHINTLITESIYAHVFHETKARVSDIICQTLSNIEGDTKTSNGDIKTEFGDATHRMS